MERILFYGDRSPRRTGDLGLPDRISARAGDKKLKSWMKWAPLSTRPIVLLGEAHTGHEVHMPHQVLRKVQPPISVLVSPSEITGAQLVNQLRTHHFWIDSSTMRAAIGGCWNGALCTRRPLKLTAHHIGKMSGMTLAARYGQIG